MYNYLSEAPLISSLRTKNVAEIVATFRNNVNNGFDTIESRSSKLEKSF